MVHKCQEGGRGSAKAKEHDSGFKKSHGGNEGHFLLVFFSKAYVIIFPAYVKLGEYCGVFHVIYQFRDEGQGICILNGVGVQVAIVLTGM